MVGLTILRHPRQPILLLAASGGGHLRELTSLADRATPAGWHRAWLVPSSPGASPGERVFAVHDVPPRDLLGAARAVPTIRRVFRELRPAAVLSTGAAIALPLLRMAQLYGIDAHYVESAARSERPSLTGRLLAVAPAVHCYSQWRDTEGGRIPWPVAGSVFDGYLGTPKAASVVRRIVVTLGTQRSYSFRRLVDRLRMVLPRNVEVLWQTGCTDLTGLPIQAQPFMEPGALSEAITQADVVIAHAGVGSALNALDAGHCPILVPRRLAHGEHVDDHQVQIARLVAGRGLAIAREVESLTFEDMAQAARRTVVRDPPGRLQLAGRLTS